MGNNEKFPTAGQQVTQWCDDVVLLVQPAPATRGANVPHSWRHCSPRTNSALEDTLYVTMGPYYTTVMILKQIMKGHRDVNKSKHTLKVKIADQ